MKIKNLLVAGLVAVSGMFALATVVNTDNAMAAFDSSQCPNGSLFKTKPAKAKPADQIKTLADCNLANDDKDLMVTATDIVNVIVGVVGVIAVFVIVLGGIFFVTSTGDAAKTKRAQHTILYGVVGLIIALLAYAIVNFVLKNVF